MAEQPNVSDFLGDPGKIPNEEIVKEINASNEKEYFSELKKKNKDFMIKGLKSTERKRIASYIIRLYNECKDKHKTDIIDKYDANDDTYRMKQFTPPGADEGTPTYRTPITAVATDVIHSNIMNVFFSPKEIMRVLPTEEADVGKVSKLAVFGNWSLDSELKIFSACDRLFHSSTKNGECPYMMYWKREYGMDLRKEIVMNPSNPAEPLYDPDTKEPIFQEIESPRLIYNAPWLEVFSRKDYIQPLNAKMGELPEWEMRIARLSFDKCLRNEKAGFFFEGCLNEVMDYGGDEQSQSGQTDYGDDYLPVGKWNKEFIEFYGLMRYKTIKDDNEDKTLELEEFEEEVISVVHIATETMCQFRKNKYPLKMRPIGVDYFMPDDSGRRAAEGTAQWLSGLQNAYDVLFNGYIRATTQANNPVIFFEPFGNMRNEKIKIEYGYAFPTANANSVKLFQFPPPDSSMNIMLELINSWVQLLFGISDYASGVESRIDPSAPARKAEIVLGQLNVRLSTILRRKNETFKDICKRWYLLYKENMPPKKYVRIAGYSDTDPWQFKSVNVSDFELSGLPDFELTGNVLNVNKNQEANKFIAIYNMMLSNPFFNPQTQKGLQALHGLTKMVLDKLDEIGLSRLLPAAPGENVLTPEEENARFVQGDIGEPSTNEDHIGHIRIHNQLLLDPNIPDEIKNNVQEHNKKHFALMSQLLTMQLIQNGDTLNARASGRFQAGGSLPAAGGGVTGQSGDLEEFNVPIEGLSV